MTCNLSRRQVLLSAAGLLAAGTLPASAASAPTLAAPAGKPILRVGGRIAVTNEGEEAVFDQPMLEALGTSRFRTSTPWTEGVDTWEGAPLAALMRAVGADGSSIRATALNDYVTDIPMEGIDEEGGILAMRRNGALMPISDKGPLFVIYPFDDNTALQHQSVFMRCAWQVARLDVL